MSFISPVKVRGMGAYRPIGDHRGFVVRKRKAGALIIYDTFTDIDNTTLSAHTPNMEINLPGDTWGSATAQLEVVSNRARVQNPNNDEFIDTDHINLSSITCRIDPANAAAQCGFGFRATAKSRANTFYVRWKHNTENRLEIIERVASVDTLRASTPKTPAVAGQPYNIELSLRGNLITFTVDGTTISYSTSVFSTNTIIGFIGIVTGDTYDTLEVRS